MYKIIRENSGIDNWNFEILETIPCNKYNELIKYEKLYYEKYNSTLNTTYPGRTDKEYYIKNKEILLEKIKKYSEKNKQKISQRNKEWRIKNKVKLLKKRKEWCEKNKKIISIKKKIKINCNFCNKFITKENIRRHQRSKYCMKIQELIKK